MREDSTGKHAWEYPDAPPRYVRPRNGSGSSYRAKVCVTHAFMCLRRGGRPRGVTATQTPQNYHFPLCLSNHGTSQRRNACRKDAALTSGIASWVLSCTTSLCQKGIGSWEAWFSWRGGTTPLCWNRQGAKRRAAGAVSGEAAERPMEPETFRAHNCVFAVPIFPGCACFLDKVSFSLSRIMV